MMIQKMVAFVKRKISKELLSICLLFVWFLRNKQCTPNFGCAQSIHFFYLFISARPNRASNRTDITLSDIK